MTADLDKLGEFDGYQNGAPGAAGTIAVPVLAATVRFSNTQPATRQGFSARYWTDFDWPRGGRMCISADGRDQRDFNPISASFPSRVLETNEVLSTLRGWSHATSTPPDKAHGNLCHTLCFGFRFGCSLHRTAGRYCLWLMNNCLDSSLVFSYGWATGTCTRIGWWSLWNWRRPTT